MKYKYIYFIEDGLGHVKIGITDDLNRRLYTLQSSNALKLSLAGYITTQDPEDERRIHMRFHKYSVRGEWFYKSIEVAEFMKKHAKHGEE